MVTPSGTSGTETVVEASEKFQRRTDNKEHAERIKAQFEYEQGLPPVAHEQTVDKLLTAYLEDRKGNVAAHDSLVHAAKPLRRGFWQHTTPAHNRPSEQSIHQGSTERR